jgi:hypothetical protein
MDGLRVRKLTQEVSCSEGFDIGHTDSGGIACSVRIVSVFPRYGTSYPLTRKPSLERA